MKEEKITPPFPPEAVRNKIASISHQQGAYDLHFMNIHISRLEV